MHTLTLFYVRLQLIYCGRAQLCLDYCCPERDLEIIK